MTQKENDQENYVQIAILFLNKRPIDRQSMQALIKAVKTLKRADQYYNNLTRYLNLI